MHWTIIKKHPVYEGYLLQKLLWHKYYKSVVFTQSEENRIKNRAIWPQKGREKEIYCLNNNLLRTTLYRMAVLLYFTTFSENVSLEVDVF